MLFLAIMPEDHELYYGFTRFAVELNEVDEDQVHHYAPTDSRFRPDQRFVLPISLTYNKCMIVHDIVYIQFDKFISLSILDLDSKWHFV